MPFCTNCGSRINDGSKFCSECGASISTPNRENTTRKSVFDGEIHKCPSCGEVLSSFVAVCPSCGYEIRGKAATNSVQQFYWELNKATNLEQKDLMIRNFPIPNTKEDILEFLILASSNIIGEDEKDIFEAWTAKFEQGYQKALLLFGQDADFSRIQQIYDEYQMNIGNEKTKKINKSAIDTIIRNIAVCVGIVAIIIAVIVDKSGGNASLIELVGYVVLIASACSLAKRGASLIDFAVGAVSGVLTIGLSFLLDNGSMGELGGGIILIIIAVTFLRVSVVKSSKEER